MLQIVAQNTSDQATNTSALLLAITEKYPEIGEAFQRHHQQIEASSPFAETTRRVIAELQRIAVEATQDQDTEKKDPSQ